VRAYKKSRSSVSWTGFFKSATQRAPIQNAPTKAPQWINELAVRLYRIFSRIEAALPMGILFAHR
jgi:hypothetical protein